MTRSKSALLNTILVVISVAFCFAILEIVLRLYPVALSNSATFDVKSPSPAIAVGEEDLPDPPADLLALEKWRHQLITMPDEWMRRSVDVPGAVSAHVWHGALEIRNADGMRWKGPIPPRRDDTYRVMVVGDSLTFGDGLAEERRFSNLLQQWMEERFRIEFVNLGQDGYQSEDVLQTIKKHLPSVRPNLVLYAVCLNDFLPSIRSREGAVGQYSHLDAYPFPLPAAVKRFFIAHTRAGAFMNEAYDSALRRMHLRADFFDDILKNFNGYQERFERDVMQMNDVVRAAGLPPLVGIVLDQFPSRTSPGYRISRIAEDRLTSAGAEVIPTEGYYRKYDGKNFHISRWEGHPDEVANWIWAVMISRRLVARSDVQLFRR